jgi:hypothetical protein
MLFCHWLDRSGKKLADNTGVIYFYSFVWQCRSRPTLPKLCYMPRMQLTYSPHDCSAEARLTEIGSCWSEELQFQCVSGKLELHPCDKPYKKYGKSCKLSETQAFKIVSSGKQIDIYPAKETSGLQLANHSCKT